MGDAGLGGVVERSGRGSPAKPWKLEIAARSNMWSGSTDKVRDPERLKKGA